MTSIRFAGSSVVTLVAIFTLAGSLSACADMTPRDTSTAVGAGVGAVAGAVLTGNTAGVVGGAAVGGVIGNQVKK